MIIIKLFSSDSRPTTCKLYHQAPALPIWSRHPTQRHHYPYPSRHPMAPTGSCDSELELGDFFRLTEMVENSTLLRLNLIEMIHKTENQTIHIDKINVEVTKNTTKE